jgi:peptidoglycan hydrolase-like protein with peptidoglycan-binding domain
MMARSARQLDLEDPWASPFSTSAAALFRVIARNPTLVGGSTAFLVALSFVSANALWYQPHAHSGAFFATRDFAGPLPSGFETETTIRIERPQAAPARPKGDPAIEEVQAILKELNFYAGDVDGLAGPNTKKAIEDYQSKMGLTVTGKVDPELLDQLGAAAQTTAGIVPIPVPRAEAVKTVPATALAAAPTGPDEQIMKIQAGLKAFGNDGIELDGVLGAQTKAAIHEFQALFGLPETGLPDDAVYAKMREIGLTN